MTATVLHTPYTFTFMRRGGGGGNAKKTEAAAATTTTTSEDTAAATTKEDGASSKPVTNAATHPYENAIKHIATVGTVEDFWHVYDFLKRPNELPTTTDYHFFRDGIKPTWEDPSNAKGGKWMVRMPKGLASRYWEEIVLALVGAQFTGVPDGEVCGAVLSIRYNEDILGMWNKTATDGEIVSRLRDSIKKILQLPSLAHLEYKPHQTSLADRSSFRNTTVWKPKSLEGGGGIGGGPTSSSGRASENRRSGSWGEREDSRAPSASNKPRRENNSRSSWRS